MIALVGPIGLGVLADVTTCPTAIVFTSAMMAAPSMIYLARAQPIPPSSADSR